MSASEEKIFLGKIAAWLAVLFILLTTIAVSVVSASSGAVGIVAPAVEGVVGESTTLEQLQGAATQAAQGVGEGSRPVHGTLVHSAFKAEVGSLSNTNLGREVFYLDGEVVPYGTPGSVCLDAVEIGPNDQIQAVYDLKTGNAFLTPTRIAQIRTQLPGGGVGVPVIEVLP